MPKRSAKSVFAPLLSVMPAVNSNSSAVCHHAIALPLLAIYKVRMSNSNEKQKWSGSMTANIIDANENNSAVSARASASFKPICERKMRNNNTALRVALSVNNTAMM